MSGPLWLWLLGAWAVLEVVERLPQKPVRPRTIRDVRGFGTWE